MRRKFFLLSVMVSSFMAFGVVPAFAQVTEPADYSTEVSSFVGEVAANAWPIALALFTAMIGITLGVALFRYILGRGRGWVKGR